MSEFGQIVVVIPAYMPAQPFLQVLHDLSAAGISNIVVVNDGSPREFEPLFSEARRAGVTVLIHPVNQGKGAALKTAFLHVLNTQPHVDGVVTCDADGQHLASDVLAVTRAFLRNRSTLVLGSRHFDTAHIPLRSRLGNDATRLIFRLIVGKRLSDTQTGLRAIPRLLMHSLLDLRTGKYDFELDMLIHAFKSHVPTQEVPITTIYTAKNELSHFNPVLDSARIYFVFVRFLMASVLSAIIDFAVFLVAQYLTGNLLRSMALARLTAGTVNFAIGRKFTFKSRGPVATEFLKYWLLVGVYLFISFSVVRMLMEEAGTNVYAAKLLAEGAMFIFSFLVQRAYVFASSTVPTVSIELPSPNGTSGDSEGTSSARPALAAVTLADEARYFHRKVFRSEPHPSVIERYVAANRTVLALRPVEERIAHDVVSLHLDVEAVELALRLRRRDNALTKKLQILLYLVEVRKSYFDLFVNVKSRRRAVAALALLASGVLAAWKLVKGKYLVWRHRLAG